MELSKILGTHVTVEQAAQEAGYHPESVRQMIRDGVVKAHRVPSLWNRYMIPRSELPGLKRRRENEKRGRPKGDGGCGA